MKKKIKSQKKISKIIHIIFLILISIVFISSLYIRINFSNESIDELFFYLTNGVENSDFNVFIDAIKECLLYGIIFILFVIGLFYNLLFGNKVLLNVDIINKNFKFNLYPINIIINHKIIFTIILTILLILLSLNNLKAFEYLKSNTIESKFIEKNYIYPEKTEVTFNKKNNLIMIFVESLETTFFTKEQGGDWDYEVIPELYDLIEDEDSVYFSSDETTGGMSELTTTVWTTGSIVSNLTSLPFKIPVHGNSYYSNNFMNGSYALGDLLKNNNYNNELISSSYTNFGGISDFFTKHGNYNIIDGENLKDVKLKKESSDDGPWGFNDKYLFNVAKERLNVLSKKKEPFNLTLIGIDTHFPDGFKGDYTLDKFDTQYENVYATESKLIYEFISWVKEQDFYEDTTIVIVGDHLSMQYDFFEGHDYGKRKRYFLIINSRVEGNNYKNRIYTSLDTYPTVLAALGAEIDGNKLGLGVNLFSDNKTLAEEFGLGYINEEIDKKSSFYNKFILGGDYLKMLSEKNNS